MWAFDQASRLRLVNSDLCMTAAAPAAADKLFAGQRPARDRGAAEDDAVVLQPCHGDVRQTFSMLSQSGASPSSGAGWGHTDSGLELAQGPFAKPWVVYPCGLVGRRRAMS